MKWPRNPRMPEDDRRFHDKGIKNRRWFEKTPLAEWLNTLSTELHNVFSRFGRDFNDSKDDQLADLLDNMQPVGTVVWAAMSPEQFSADKWGRWMLADGSAAPRDSKFFKRGLGYQQNGSQERFLPDCRKYIRVPGSQEELLSNRGQLNDTVSASGLGVTNGTVSGSVSTSCNFGQVTVSEEEITLYAKKMSRGGHRPGYPLNYNPEADQASNEQHRGGHIFTEGISASKLYNQSFLAAAKHIHQFILNKTFTGSMTSGTASGMQVTSPSNETRPKTQLLNAFVRID